MKIYGRETDPRDQPETVKVGIADYAVAQSGVTFTTSGLGSCVGVALYDRRARVGGLAHVMLPASRGAEGENEAKYADTAIAAMLAEMNEQGARCVSISAKLAGGSSVLDFESLNGDIGTRNVEAVEAALADRGVAIAAADVGGDHGRSLRFESATATLLVRSAAKGVKEI